MVKRKQSVSRVRLREGNAFVPVSVNGREAAWFFDTGANWSIVSESEARRVGMEIRDTASKVTDATGKAVSMRLANARELRLGEVHLQNVAFIVVRDDQQPFVELQPGERGGIGLPVMLAAGSVSWDKEGVIEFGGRGLDGPPNLAFEGSTPLAEIEFAGRKIAVHLDTGADQTHLWPKFAKEFAAVLETGQKRKFTFSGVGHRVEVDSIHAPELRLGIGGREILFQPAIVLLEQEGEGAKYFYGNLGTDLLSQANRVTIDFRSMRLALE